MIEYKDALSSVVEEKHNWLYLSEEELLIKLRMRYRAEAMKTYNKTWVTKSMPTNNDLPQCALAGTRDMASDSGYDSLLDQSPLSRDKLLNQRDNEREAASRKQAELELGFCVQEPPHGTSDERLFDSDDDLPISSIARHKLSVVAAAEDNQESDEENEFN